MRGYKSNDKERIFRNKSIKKQLSKDLLVLLKKAELFYENSDAIIFPSQLESWGLPISESIQFKKIIFLPDLEYSRETCGNYDNAIFFSSGSYLELRNKLFYF